MSWHYQIAHRVHQNGDHWYSSIREVRPTMELGE